MPFKPKIHECTVEDGGESLTIFIKEPSGREILKAAEDSKRNPDRPAIENARKLFADYVVHQDGGNLTNEEVDEIVDMRLSAMNKISELVQEKIGLKTFQDKAKNA